MNQKRLDFIELTAEYVTEWEWIKQGYEERNDGIYKDCSALFNKFWEDTCKLFEE